MKEYTISFQELIQADSEEEAFEQFKDRMERNGVKIEDFDVEIGPF